MIFSQTDRLFIALNQLYPNLWQQNNGSVDEILWKDGHQTTPEEKSALVSKLAEINTQWEAAQYQRQRVQEYPPIGDQLDALFKAGVFPADMAAAIQAVKDKYPKGTA